MRTTASVTTAGGVSTISLGPVPKGYELRKVTITYVPTGDAGPQPTFQVAITDSKDSGSFAGGDAVTEVCTITDTTGGTFTIDVYINRRVNTPKYLQVRLDASGGGNVNVLASLDAIPRRNQELYVP